VAERLANKGKYFICAEFVIACILATAEELSPEKNDAISRHYYSFSVYSDATNKIFTV
jgi:hypothetical protein